MRRTEELHALIDREGIVLRYYELPEGRDGLYVYTKSLGRPHIFLRPELAKDAIAYRSVLAHEVGHHFTLAGDYSIHPSTEYDRPMRSKFERLAERWAIDYMVPVNDLMSLCRKGYPVWEIAERLQVPEEWVVDKLRRVIGS